LGNRRSRRDKEEESKRGGGDRKRPPKKGPTDPAAGNRRGERKSKQETNNRVAPTRAPFKAATEPKSKGKAYSLKTEKRESPGKTMGWLRGMYYKFGKAEFGDIQGNLLRKIAHMQGSGLNVDERKRNYQKVKSVCAFHWGKKAGRRVTSQEVKINLTRRFWGI